MYFGLISSDIQTPTTAVPGECVGSEGTRGAASQDRIQHRCPDARVRDLSHKLALYAAARTLEAMNIQAEPVTAINSNLQIRKQEQTSEKDLSRIRCSEAPFITTVRSRRHRVWETGQAERTWEERLSCMILIQMW
jgi:hypothetical protein